MSIAADLPRPQLRNPAHLLAFGLGSGLAPRAPGTFGTLAALPLAWLLQPLDPWFYGVITLALFVFGVWICDQTSRDLGVHDHPGIVFDEWVGLLVTLWWAPIGWSWLLIGFVLFRVFDILKPWPIRWLDRHVKGGFGIMVDDLLAGFLALCVIQGLHWLF